MSNLISNGMDGFWPLLSSVKVLWDKFGFFHFNIFGGRVLRPSTFAAKHALCILPIHSNKFLVDGGIPPAFV